MFASFIRRLTRLGVLAPIVTCLACAGTAGRLVDRAGRDVEREVGTRVVDHTVGAVADAAEGAGTEDSTDRAGSSSASSESAETADVPRGGEGADPNFDFQRGDRGIFLEDYASDNLGDFPRRLELLNGNWEVVEWEGARYLRGTGGRGSSFDVVLPETLPERFTVEFDVMFTHTNQEIVMSTSPLGPGWTSYDASLVQVRNVATGLVVPKSKRESTARVTSGVEPIDTPTTIRLMVDGSHAKVYAGTMRVANVPNAVIRRSDRLHFQDVYTSDAANPVFIGAIRVDAGGRDLYAAIEREGHVAVHDILFDTNSDRIRPESRPVLEEIATMLSEHAELRLSIEGHTDDRGSDSYNLDLSQRRADAVRRWLVDRQAIDEGRLRSVGVGESGPVASNETDAGRQENRRVELVQIR